jgi:hypothetical protein
MPRAKQPARDSGVKFAFVECATNSENFVLAIAHASDNGEGVARIDLLDIQVPPIFPQAVVRKFASTLRARGIDHVMGARHSSLWAKERFARFAIGYDFCELERGDLKRAFVALVEDKRAVLPPNEELRKQFQTLLNRQKYLGGPDDLIVACGGAALQAVGIVGPVTAMADYA